MARFASSSVMNVEWPSGELAVAVSASLWAQRLMAEADHHAGLVRHRWRLDRARQARPVCLSCAWSSFARAAHEACCIFGTFISTNKMFTLPASATADVVSTASRPCATGVKETTVARTRTVRVSAPGKRPLCSASELKN